MDEENKDLGPETPGADDEETTSAPDASVDEVEETEEEDETETEE